MATKKRLIGLLLERISAKLGISPQDIETTIFEIPKHNWDIQGLPGDELEPNHRVEV